MAQKSKSNYAIIPSRLNEYYQRKYRFCHNMYNIKIQGDPIIIKKVSFKYVHDYLNRDFIFVDIPLEGLTNDIAEDEDEIIAIGISGNPILSNLHDMVTQIADSFIREHHPDPFPKNNNNFISRIFFGNNYRPPLSESDIQDYINQVVNHVFRYNKKKNSCQLRFRIWGSTCRYPTPVIRVADGPKLTLEALGKKQHTGTIEISGGSLMATKNDVVPCLNFIVKRLFVKD